MPSIASRRLVLKDPPMDDRRHQHAKPLVSVVIPTYNRARYIAETIDSVLAQTYDNVEIIVIDDGSTDNTAEVVAPFLDRIRYIQQVNSERGAARNHGLRLATGKYIAFLDSDDLWLPRKAEQGVAFLEANPHVGLIYTDAIQIDGEGRQTRKLHARGPSGHVTAKLLERNFVGIATQLARTSIVRDVDGFREERELSGSEDWEMWVRMSLMTEFAYLPEVTAKVRTHPDNTMTDAAVMQRSMAKAAQLFRGNEALLPYKRVLGRMDAQTALVNAINYCSNGKRGQALGFLRRALAAQPSIIFDLRYPYTILRLLKAQ